MNARTFTKQQKALLYLALAHQSSELLSIVKASDPFALPLSQRNEIREAIGSEIGYGFDGDEPNELAFALEELIDLLGPRGDDP